MKKYKIIGLSVLVVIFITSNFIISHSFNQATDSSINLFMNQARADGEGDYGNNLDGYCAECTMPLPNGEWGDGVYISCVSAYNSLCYAAQCGGGFCN